MLIGQTEPGFNTIWVEASHKHIDISGPEYTHTKAERDKNRSAGNFVEYNFLESTAIKGVRGRNPAEPLR